MGLTDHAAELCKGETLADEGKYDACIALCDGVLHEETDSAAALSLKAWCQSKQGKHREALTTYREAVGHLPVYPPLRKALAKCLVDNVLHEEAELEFAEAVRLDALDGEAHLGLGTCRLALGNPTEGLRDIRTAVDIDPELKKQAEDICSAFVKAHGIDLSL